MKLPTWQDIVSIYDRAMGWTKPAPTPPPLPPPPVRQAQVRGQYGAVGQWATLFVAGGHGSHAYPTWGPPHDTGIGVCWCGPKYQCLTCDATGPCIHGVHRREVIVHRLPS